MDIEFHYYITHLIAAKAGFGPKEAGVIAHASQYVDDNDQVFEVDRGEDSAYQNYISQTMNILKPMASLLRIYPLFHFIPGDPQAQSAFRKDGKMHWMNTTPNSKNANAIIDAALDSQNLYRIGIAAHAYVDTWAHQNFVGYEDHFNAMEGPLAECLPNIGHADAKHDPDWPGLIWEDVRLIDGVVNNKQRFLDAAGHLFEKLARFTDRATSDKALLQGKAELIEDISLAIGEPDHGNAQREARIGRYRELAATKAAYKGAAIPAYDADGWFDAAVNEDVRGWRDRLEGMLAPLDPFPDTYSWKDRDGYQQTDWWRFQEAVKDHQNEAWEILSQTNLKGLELPKL